MQSTNIQLLQEQTLRIHPHYCIKMSTNQYMDKDNTYRNGVVLPRNRPGVDKLQAVTNTVSADTAVEKEHTGF